MTQSTVNGLDTQRLGQLAQALDGKPDAGVVTFSCRTGWGTGARTLTDVSGYAIDGAMQHAGARRFVVLSDEPTEISGTDTAPAPAEQLLAALGSCIAATANAKAAFMGVTLSRLDIELSGEIDLHGILGLDAAVRPGFQEIRARVTIAGDADDDTLRTIASLGMEASPIRDSVERGVRLAPQVTIGS